MASVVQASCANRPDGAITYLAGQRLAALWHQAGRSPVERIIELLVVGLRGLRSLRAGNSLQYCQHYRPACLARPANYPCDRHGSGGEARCETSVSKIIGLLATRRRVNRPYTEDLMARYGSGMTLHRHGSAKLVLMAVKLPCVALRPTPPNLRPRWCR